MLYADGQEAANKLIVRIEGGRQRRRALKPIRVIARAALAFFGWRSTSQAEIAMDTT
jgi:hypothetical protein